MGLQRIDLESQREYAYHGCLDEEAMIGSEYRIDLSVFADLYRSAQSDELKDTVDYVALRQIISEEMAIRAKLLETVAARIVQRIFSQHPQVARAEVKVCKLNPPIDGDVHAVCVAFLEENPLFTGKAL
ncbi:dihydroneopterin aldolase [Schleiferiaceae bacterium]|jgi:dihydroneopterin aldolase|nr:dihydroneopterin aldolase [Schleiferiaceae bacterium]